MLTTHDVKNYKIGDVVNIANINWIVANRTEDTMSFVSDKILGKTVWNVPHVVIKPEHGVHQIGIACKFKESIVNYSCIWMYALICSNATFELIRDEETQAFVHPTTKEQLEGEWKYFNDHTARACFDLNGNLCDYWTSSVSSSGNVWFVGSDGDLYSGRNPSYTLGFRPAFTIRI